MKTLNVTRYLVFGSGLLLSAVAAAADFDGSAPFNCDTRGGYTCEPGKGCSKIEQQSEANAVITVDPGNKTVKSPYQADLLPIAHSVRNKEQLQIQGTSEKFAWSAVINRQTGNNCYDIIKEYKGGFDARFYQTVAFFFSSNLKQPYDAKGDDQAIESIVQEIERMYHS